MSSSTSGPAAGTASDPTTDLGPRSPASEVRRLPQRAAYDAPTIHAILDAGLVGHLGFSAGGRPLVIPMLYGRDGDRLYLHGSVASRLQRTLSDGVEVCLTVTHIDGLVLARSTFHHSMNYRSVVVLGRARKVEDEEKEHGLQVITEHLAPGRWDAARRPNRAELRQTSVLRLDIDEASAKVRTGGPVDDEEDLDLPVWAGVLPCRLEWGEPEPDEPLAAGAPAFSLARAR
jgi:nitroimidazol reductase NimA-like FMN-containing flavoprotein (pyridoxamine 5'-phosphate oxidase superfamily)